MENELVTLSLKCDHVSSLIFDSTFSESVETITDVYVFYAGEGAFPADTDVTVTRRVSAHTIADGDDFKEAIPRTPNQQFKIYGYIKNGSDKLILFCNYGNIDVFRNNAELTYPSYDSSNVTSDYINKCSFGILYTDQYAQNRLVITGNQDIPNCDWWNEDINVYAHSDDSIRRQDLMYNDFTYFPDENYCYYGNDKGKIIGYDVDENGKLVVFKENNGEDPTIYFREGVQVYQGNNSLNQSQYVYKLNMYSGNSGLYPLNHKCILNFAGRTIFFSNEKNVSLLVSTNVMQDKGKYSISCSQRLDNKLQEFNKTFLNENAFLFSDNKFLYLVLGSVILVARYDELASDYQYEWYLLDTGILDEDETITTMLKREDITYFGTSKGNIFEIDNEVKDVYQDNKKTWLESGDFTENVLNSTIAKEVHEGDLLKTNYYIRFNELSNTGKLSLSGDQFFTVSDMDTARLVMFLINSGKQIYLIGKENPTNVKPITINYDSTSNRYALTEAVFTGDLAIAIKQDNNDTLEISKLNEAGSFNLIYKVENNFPYSQVDLINLEATYTGYIEHLENVSAVYITAPFSMGTLNQYKNIISYTITNDTRKKSELGLAITSNSIPLEEAKKVGLINDIFGFSLSLFDFTSLSLAQDYIPARSYTKYRNIVRQRFTNFVFFNKEDTNAVLSDMSIVYTKGNAVVGGD